MMYYRPGLPRYEKQRIGESQGVTTVFEKEKREDFNQMMGGISRGIGLTGRRLSQALF